MNLTELILPGTWNAALTRTRPRLEWLVAALVLLAHTTSAAVRLVNVNNPSPAPPYLTWATAATNIQDAVDVAAGSDEVLVTNGVYQTGGQPVYGGLTNRVAVTKPIAVRSVHGPAVTVIQGVPGFSPSAVRCVYLTNGASMAGFTLTNGGTFDAGDDGTVRSGGAIWGESTRAVASNCVLTANAARRWGGGAAFVTLLDCVLTGNSAEHGGGVLSCALTNCVLTNNVAYYGGGGRDSIFDRCIINDNLAWNMGGGVMTSTVNGCGLTNNRANTYGGGGAYGGTLGGCSLVGNSAAGAGGGVADATLYHCLLAGNSGASGGGAAFSGLNNCALWGNSAGGNGGAASSSGLNNCTVLRNSASIGGGVESSGLNNCIVVCNLAGSGPNYANSTLNYSCSTPLPSSGVGNTAADPLLTDNTHLSAASPCRGAGSPAYAAGTDLDGQGWASPPSMGCDEFYPGGTTGPLSVELRAAYTNVATGFALTLLGQVRGHAAENRWDFDDGTVASNRLSATHAWAVAGDYAVVFRAFNDSNPGGVSATVTVHVVTQPVHYVSASSTTPAPPYSSWGTAATSIQEAVDAATLTGALVLVSNGVYQTGGQPALWSLSNRVAVTKPLRVQSLNGPAVTIIQGTRAAGTTNGDSAMRCVYLGNDAALIGFTLTNGATRSSGEFLNDQTGGGVRCEATALVSNCVLIANAANGAGGAASGGTLSHCTLVGNTSVGSGGGAYDCTLERCGVTTCAANEGGGVSGCSLTGCTVAGNTAGYGGGANASALNTCAIYQNSATAEGGGTRACTLNNCTVSGNSAPIGGGASGGWLANTILFGNAANLGANAWGGTLNYCFTSPLPASGSGNLTGDPLLADGAHLSANSPCRAAGNATYAAGTDIDDEPWANPPSIGCDEYVTGPAIGPLAVALRADYTNVATGFAVNLTATITGHASSNRWELGDGTMESNRLSTTHRWVAAGDYSVVFRAYNAANPGGVGATATVHVVAQPVHYVSASSASPVPPYISWATAAAQIQDAVDSASVAGALVLVTNGVYQTGGKVIFGALTNRVAVNKPVWVSSVNGPAQTLISGNRLIGDSAVRCVYLGQGAVLSGFTLTNGASRNAGDPVLEQSGGGVWCEPIGVVVSNCLVLSNSVAWYGGGVFGGSLYDCVLLGNAGYIGGAAYGSALDHCQLGGNAARTGGGAQSCALESCSVTNNTGSSSGGGACGSTLSRCLIRRNHAGNGGGGAQSCTLNNCLVAGNSAGEGGGGASECTLNNCTVVTNSSSVDFCALNNCIVYYNAYESDYGDTWNYCCTPMPVAGPGNFTNAPLFLDLAGGDFHLQSGSPCINSGDNAYAPGNHDLDGNPRIARGTVDSGAYEFGSPASQISYAWLVQFGLATDGSADFTDADADGMNNWQEWKAGTVPTDASSALRMLEPTPPAMTLRWLSVTNRHYFLERATTLVPSLAFSLVASNIPGQAGTTSYRDGTAPIPGPAYYRVGVMP